MPSPNLIIDGRRLVQNPTGVGRYLSLLLNQWALAPEKLAFSPLVKRHRPNASANEPWQAAFPAESIGSRLPGLAWENLCLASGPHRRLPLFAPANLVPWRWAGPVVLVIHDTFSEYPDSGLSWLQRLQFRSRYRQAAQRADLILTPSQATADDVQRFFRIPETRIRKISPGLPVKFNSNKGLFNQGGFGRPPLPYLLFVGKKSKRRYFGNLLQAIGNLRQKGLAIRLVAVGPTGTDYKIDEGFEDLGHVPDDTLIQLYQHAMALVSPSSREGFGLPLAEAMACGCPVIARAQGALVEVVGDACLNLKSQEVGDIESAIRNLMENNELQRHLSEAGLQRARLFQVGRFAEEVASALAEFVP